MKAELDRRDGILGLALIKNTKTVDPADPSSPEVVQIETAMGAAIEVFDGATTIEVTRERFVPVKTTNDLLVLRSDCYELSEDYVLELVSGAVPFVDLDPRHFKLVGEFDACFPDGVPSMRGAGRLVVHGNWVFGADVTVVGEVEIEDRGTTGRVEAGTTLG